MAVPNHVTCKIVQDLLIGYVAGEVSPETGAFVTAHLDQCPACRQALAQYTDASHSMQQMAPPAPPADPGRRTIGRVRRAVWVIVGVVALCLALTAGTVTWALVNMRGWTNMPYDQPVPGVAYTEQQVAEKVDLTSLGLGRPEIGKGPYGTLASYAGLAGRPVRVEYTREDPRDAFNRWSNSFRTKITSVEMNVGGHPTAKFRSGGYYYYGWQQDGWFITIAVSETAGQPTVLRDQIRDQLFSAFRALQ